MNEHEGLTRDEGQALGIADKFRSIDQGRRGNERTIKPVVILCGLVGLITFLLQFNSRYTACSGAMRCGLSFIKGIVWSAIWRWLILGTTSPMRD
jgi:hypothetical protein